MAIDGEVTLVHEGHHQANLMPFEQDRFSGGWTTKSFGKVRDFNLMLADGCNGKLEIIAIEKDGYYATIISNNRDGRQLTEAFYCINGPVHITIGDDGDIVLEEGDLIQITLSNWKKHLYKTT